MSLAALHLNISEFRQTVSEPAPVARICAGISMALLFAASYHANMHLGVLCLAWLTISLASGLARKFRPELYLDLFMLLGLVPSSFVWIIEYAADWQGSTAPLVLHPGLLYRALLAGPGSWGLPGRQEFPAQGTSPAPATAPSVAPGLPGPRLHLHQPRSRPDRRDHRPPNPQVRGAAVSIWWGIFAVLLITVGFWKRVSPPVTSAWACSPSPWARP